MSAHFNTLPTVYVGQPVVVDFGYLDGTTGGWRYSGSDQTRVTGTVTYRVEGEGDLAHVVGRIAFTPQTTGLLQLSVIAQTVAGQDPNPATPSVLYFTVQPVTAAPNLIKAVFYTLATYKANTALSIPLGHITDPASGGVWSIKSRGNLPSNATLSTAGVLSANFSTTLTCAFELELTATDYIALRATVTFAVAEASPEVIDVRWSNSLSLKTDAANQTVLLGTAVSPTANVTWTLFDRGNLPTAAALSVNGLSASLVATFSAAGTYSGKVRVTAPGKAKLERAFSIGVSAAPTTILVSPRHLRDAFVNTAYSDTLGTVAWPANVTWTLSTRGDLPQNATVSSAGLLEATFSTAADYSTGVATVAKEGYPSVTVPIQLKVYETDTASHAIQIRWATSLPSPVVGVAYSQSLGTLIGGPNTVSWRVEETQNLPGAVTLSTSGVLSGTFPAKGLITFKVQVKASLAADFTYAPVSQDFRLVVVTAAEADPPPPPPIYGTTETQDGTQWLVEHVATDDGGGHLLPTQNGLGTVDYATGELYFPVEDYFPSKTWSDAKTGGIGEWRSVLTTDTFGQGAEISVTYQPDAVEPTDATETLPPALVTLQLTPYSTDVVVPGTVQFRLGSTTYQDNEGMIIKDADGNGVGTTAGKIDYATGTVLLDNWTAGAQTLTLQSLATQRGQFTETAFRFRTAVAPLRPGGLQFAVTAVDGALLAGSPDLNGVITGEAMEGTFDAEFGVVSLRFGEMVDVDTLTDAEKAEEWYDEDDIVNGEIWQPRKVIPATARYNAVAYSSLPLSAELLGLDPVRLPSDGRVPCIIKGDMVIIQHHTTHEVATPVAGGTLDTELTGVARVRVYDVDGDAVSPDRYSLAQDTGILTWANPLDLAAWTGPFGVEATIEDAALVTDADLSGRLLLNRVLTHAYPENATVSSAYVFGDLYSQATTPFSQQAWTSVWQSERIGNPILAQYNSLLYPLELTNASSWRERWLLLFTSGTSFRVIGETLGDITDALGGSGYHDISHDLAPVNPITSTPYFTLPWEGWSGGWVAGNCLRFDTIPPANFPVWIAMTVHPGAPTTGQDRFRLLLRGGVNA